ncbi:MAG: hypothetical protein J1E85_01200 [Ruminococcus sp.]|nr:hypothetical protein [Ruminococcus sp.]
MKLFIRRNISADKTAFVIFNEQGYEKYYIIPKKKKGFSGFELTSINGDLICKVRKMQICNVSAYSIKDKSRMVRFVCVPVSSEIKCRFYGVNWHIAGEAVSKNFGIMDVDNSVIATHKTVGSDYELNVFDDVNEIISIATCICINLINTVDNRATQAV